MVPLRLVGLFAVTAVVLMYFYTSVPEGLAADDRWVVRKFYAMAQGARIVARLGSWFGYGSAINITRALRNSRFALVHPDKYPVISTPHSFDGVNVVIHRKKTWIYGKPLRPALVYIHGGGWVYEFAEIFAILERYLVDRSNSAVISVDYPLAPENPYPVPFLGCLKVVKYLHKNAEKFGIDPKKISIGGDSSGGNLAAAVALKLRDEGENFLREQILISPALQFATFRLDSYEENDFSIPTKTDIIRHWLLYINQSDSLISKLEASEHVPKAILGHPGWTFLKKYLRTPAIVAETGTKKWKNKLLDPYLSPMFADSLKGLPSTVMVAVRYDCLRDEGLAYAERLKMDGVNVTVLEPTTFHGAYCFFQDSKLGTEIVDQIAYYLQKSSSLV